MKKIISILLIMVMLIPVTSVYAAKKTQISEMEIEIPDNYTLLAGDGETAFYSNSQHEFEALIISTVENIGYENIEDVPDSQAINLGDAFLNQDMIVKAFQVLGKNMTRIGGITPEYEWVDNANGVMFLGVAKTFAAEFDDGKQRAMYSFLFITIRNGKCYLVFEFGDLENNDLDAFSELINNVSFNKSEVITPPTDDHDIKILVDGVRVYPDSEPVIINGRTLCPIRAIAEKIGYNVDWDGNTRTVTIKNEEREIQLTIGGSKITGYRIQYDPIGLPDRIDINYTIEVPAQIINDRTYLPVRAVSEALRCLVDWDGDTRTVEIESAYYGEKVYLIKESGNYHKIGVYCPFYEINKILYHTEEYLNDMILRRYTPCPCCFPEEK